LSVWKKGAVAHLHHGGFEVGHADTGLVFLIELLFCFRFRHLRQRLLHALVAFFGGALAVGSRYT